MRYAQARMDICCIGLRRGDETTDRQVAKCPLYRLDHGGWRLLFNSEGYGKLEIVCSLLPVQYSEMFS